MNVQDQVNPQEEARKIWDQIDAEESGPAAPSDDYDQDPAPDARAQETGQPSADEADETATGDEAASDPMMDKVAGLEAQLSQALQRLRQAEGHIGTLNSQLKQQLQTAQQVTAKGGDAPSAKQIADAQANPEAMARLKEDYPEFATAMESALKAELQAFRQQLQAMQQPTEQAPSVRPEEIQRLRAEMAVEVRHPGWQDTVRTPEFLGWLNRQPRELQMLATSDSPQDAVRLLDVYGQNMRTTTSQRTQRLTSAAALPSGRPGAAVRQKSTDEMTPQEYWRYLDELDRQKG